MIIVCSGPDTYSARQKARELGDAFKQKFDPSGYSTEVMTTPDVKELMNRMSAPSFFATKRFIRCDGLFAKIKIADVRALAKRVEADGDTTIVVTVEDETPPEKHTSEFEKGRIVLYPYPLLQGSKFLAWCVIRAKTLGATEQDAKEIAERTDGDAWFAEQELMKRAVNPKAELVEV
jgi:DNA polymerase III delta subunit